MSSENTFTHFLEQLNVKHTNYYAGKLFNEHPDKYNLLGMSDILTMYGIENAGFTVEQKEIICTASPPFIAFAGGDFVIVEKINTEQTQYVWNGKRIDVTTNEFLKMWSGVVLLAQPNEHSIEPDYRLHKQQENIRKLVNYTMVAAVAFVFLTACLEQRIYAHLGMFVLLLLNIAGAYIGYLLLLKHMHIHGGYGNRICSLFKQTDCNNILESDATILFGVISWSEIGLSYFLSNIIVLLLFPQLLGWMVLINLVALPYTFWSIWHQVVIARQWCPLCMMVQALLWLLFVVNLSFSYIHVPSFDLWQITILAGVYFIPLLLIHQTALLFTNKHRIEQVTQEMNSIKANEKVFSALLGEQPRYTVSHSDSSVIFGNPSSKLLVTVLTNPHCNPCARMNDRIKEILKLSNIKVQYIFSSFSQELEISAQYLIAIYLQKSSGEREQIYSKWFEKGNLNKELFFEEYPVKMDDVVVMEEFNRHKAWLTKSLLRATPTILVNGFKLPDNYQIEDLKYFSDFEFEF